MARFDIEEIMMEAHAMGIREQVLEAAGHLIRNNTYHDISVAYNEAYEYCTQTEHYETYHNAANSFSCDT